MTTDTLGLFRELDLFQGRTTDDLGEFKRLLPMFAVNKGRLIVVPDRGEQSLFVLKRGSVRLYRLSPEGRQVTVGELGPGDIFGTLSVIGAIGRRTYAEATSECVICKIDQHRLAELIDGHPDIAVRLIAIVDERLAAAEDQIEDLVFRTAEQRIARSILQLVGSANGSEINVSHEDIARRAGVARETVTKMLKGMERRGFVKTGYRSLKILDAMPFEKRAAD